MAPTNTIAASAASTFILRVRSTFGLRQLDWPGFYQSPDPAKVTSVLQRGTVAGDPIAV